MLTLKLTYRSGAEVLESTWGYLSCGGLLVHSAPRLERGLRVLCRVAIDSMREVFDVPGQVLSERANHDGQYYVALDRCEAQDLLLTAAWAEAERVPQRRWRRVAADAPAEIALGGRGTPPSRARLVNVSRGGCCLRGPLLPIDSAVRVEAAGLVATGHVRWTTRGAAGEMGIEFDDPIEPRAVERIAVSPARKRPTPGPVGRPADPDGK